MRVSFCIKMQTTWLGCQFCFYSTSRLSNSYFFLSEAKDCYTLHAFVIGQKRLLKVEKLLLCFSVKNRIIFLAKRFMRVALRIPTKVSLRHRHSLRHRRNSSKYELKMWKTAQLLHNFVLSHNSYVISFLF